MFILDDLATKDLLAMVGKKEKKNKLAASLTHIKTELNSCNKPGVPSTTSASMHFEIHNFSKSHFKTN